MPHPPQRRDNVQRLVAYLQDHPEPKLAVFDIGTRANRLLVGPKEPPAANWGRDLFFNAGEVTNLGQLVNRFAPVVKADNAGLREVVDFIWPFRELLDRAGLGPADIITTGTAVFRWIKNQDEVLRIIQDQAGVDLRILDGEKEAFFSLEAVYATYKFRQQAEWSGDLSENDAILLLDQGGGSTEISCLSPTREGFMMKFQSFDQLGTTALRDRFFTTGSDGRVDPTKNQKRIFKQNERIREHIAAEIKKWDAYPELAGKHILPYAMGSAVTECFKCNSYSIHNRCLTVDRMLEISDQRCSEIDNSTQSVSTLYRKLDTTPGSKANNLDGVLTQLYGLPVYRGFLEKLGLDHLLICGYGLRYGVYSHVCVYHQPLPS